MRFKHSIEDCVHLNARIALADNVVGNLPEPVKRDKHDKAVAKYTYRDWFEKIAEEVFEAHQAACKNKSGQLAEELTDVITVCVSFLNILGYDEKGRGDLYRKVNQKNLQRGYLE